MKAESPQLALNDVHLIPLKQIIISDQNVRMHNRDKDIDLLAESINKHGLLQPVVLRGVPGKPPYQLIVGQRRFLAHKYLAKKNLLKDNNIKAIFAGGLQDIDATVLSLSENMHRVELNDVDKAEAITHLYLHYKKDEVRVSRELGLPTRTVRDYIKIEEQATRKAKYLLKKGSINKADVKRIIDASQGDDKKADELLGEMTKLTKYEKQRAVEYGKNNPKASTKKIIEEALNPTYKPTIVLNIPKEIGIALDKAKILLSMEHEEIAQKALGEWLRERGFLD